MCILPVVDTLGRFVFGTDSTELLLFLFFFITGSSVSWSEFEELFNVFLSLIINYRSRQIKCNVRTVCLRWAVNENLVVVASYCCSLVHGDYTWRWTAKMADVTKSHTGRCFTVVHYWTRLRERETESRAGVGSTGRYAVRRSGKSGGDANQRQCDRREGVLWWWQTTIIYNNYIYLCMTFKPQKIFMFVPVW